MRVSAGWAEAHAGGWHLTVQPGPVRSVMHREIVGQRHERERAGLLHEVRFRKAGKLAQDRPGAGLGPYADPVVDGVGLVGVGEQTGEQAPVGLVIALQLFEHASTLVEKGRPCLVALDGIAPDTEGALRVIEFFMTQPGVDGGVVEVRLDRERGLESGCRFGSLAGNMVLYAEIVPGRERLSWLALLRKPHAIERDRAEFADTVLRRVHEVDHLSNVERSEGREEVDILQDVGAPIPVVAFQQARCGGQTGTRCCRVGVHRGAGSRMLRHVKL